MRGKGWQNKSWGQDIKGEAKRKQRQLEKFWNTPCKGGKSKSKTEIKNKSECKIIGSKRKPWGHQKRKMNDRKKDQNWDRCIIEGMKGVNKSYEKKV